MEIWTGDSSLSALERRTTHGKPSHSNHCFVGDTSFFSGSFKTFSLVLVFSNLIMKSLSVDFFQFFQDGISSAFWILSMSFTKPVKFSDIMSLNIFKRHRFSPLFLGLQWHKHSPVLVVLWVPETLLIFLHLFSLRCSDEFLLLCFKLIDFLLPSPLRSWIHPVKVFTQSFYFSVPKFPFSFSLRLSLGWVILF